MCSEIIYSSFISIVSVCTVECGHPREAVKMGWHYAVLGRATCCTAVMCAVLRAVTVLALDQHQYLRTRSAHKQQNGWVWFGCIRSRPKYRVFGNGCTDYIIDRGIYYLWLPVPVIDGGVLLIAWLGSWLMLRLWWCSNVVVAWLMLRLRWYSYVLAGAYCAVV